MASAVQWISSELYERWFQLHWCNKMRNSFGHLVVWKLKGARSEERRKCFSQLVHGCGDGLRWTLRSIHGSNANKEASRSKAPIICHKRRSCTCVPNNCCFQVQRRSSFVNSIILLHHHDQMYSSRCMCEHFWLFCVKLFRVNGS